MNVPKDISREMFGTHWKWAGSVGTSDRGSAVCISGEYVYVIGGLDGENKAYASCYRYVCMYWCVCMCVCVCEWRPGR